MRKVILKRTCAQKLIKELRAGGEKTGLILLACGYSFEDAMEKARHEC